MHPQKKVFFSLFRAFFPPILHPFRMLIMEKKYAHCFPYDSSAIESNYGERDMHFKVKNSRLMLLFKGERVPDAQR